MNWQRRVLASRGYLELGMFEDATLALEQINAEDKTRREVSHATLIVHLAAENWDMAVAIAADIVKAEPKKPGTWILLARAVRHAGSVEQMEMVLFKARAWHPRDPLILFKLACCASVTGRIEEAKLRISNAIDLDENVRRLALHEGRRGCVRCVLFVCLFGGKAAGVGVAAFGWCAGTNSSTR
jgi:Flp pilus assembly protein TadD